MPGEVGGRRSVPGLGTGEGAIVVDLLALRFTGVFFCSDFIADALPELRVAEGCRSGWGAIASAIVFL